MAFMLLPQTYFPPCGVGKNAYFHFSCSKMSSLFTVPLKLRKLLGAYFSLFRTCHTDTWYVLNQYNVMESSSCSMFWVDAWWCLLGTLICTACTLPLEGWWAGIPTCWAGKAFFSVFNSSQKQLSTDKSANWPTVSLRKHSNPSSKLDGIASPVTFCSWWVVETKQILSQAAVIHRHSMLWQCKLLAPARWCFGGDRDAAMGIMLDHLQ